MSRRIVFLLIIFCLSFASFAQRVKYNFNSDWKVFVGDPKGAEQTGFDDASWKSVTLPYAWNEDEAFRKDIRDLSTGIAWYRKKFKLPESVNGLHKIFLEFEGIRQAGVFYVNGREVGMHENGVTAFGFDVTDKVKLGEENVVAVRIDNSWDYKEQATGQKFQWEDKNFNANYGGINKNVFLYTTYKVYQTLPLYSDLKTKGVYVYATNHDIKKRSAIIHAESEVKNESPLMQEISYEIVITNLENKPVKSFSGGKTVLQPGATAIVKAVSPVENLNFWSWGYGYLYNVKTILKISGEVVDEVTTRTGFRKTEFKNGMIYLNDRVIMVHGYAQRTSNEWPAVGLSVPAWLSDYSNGLMVKSNGNLVRWMHITPWKQDVESCDRVGLMQAMPAGDAEADVSGTRWEQRKAVMRDAIIYNRNNPSIIFYECGNENISEPHMIEMKAIRDQYDPNGGRAIGSREMLTSTTAEYGGEMLYTNKSGDIPVWAMEYSRDEGSRKYWDDFTPPFHKDGAGPLHNGQDASSYNRNMESHALENVKRWYEFWRERPGTGNRVSSGGVNIIFSETNTHHRGEENYRRSGEVDALRIIKENFYAHKIMWDGWVEPEKHGIHIIGHWNYEKGVKKNIYVISSADHVELKVNGNSLGFGEKSDGFIFTFKDVEWREGNIRAVGYDDKGKRLCEALKYTTLAPVALRLTNIASPKGFIADGHDLALIEVEVVDRMGRRVPTALNMISYTVKGPAVWRGGMAMGPDNYTLTQTFPVEGGVNRALIRSTTTAGTIVITVSSPGLKPATLTLQSKPFSAQNGLSSTMPSDGLPVNLERGPTPLTPSFKPLRNLLNIANATAGAHADSVNMSFDDNELSDWVNDGLLSSAWIEYELEKEATVNEVSLKLNNFRSRSYPLRITVDGIEVFNSVTPRSLGYVTLRCKPQKGRKIRITLVGDSKDAATNQMVEVDGKKLDDGVARDDARAKGTLSIIEAEIYEVPTPAYPFANTTSYKFDFGGGAVQEGYKMVLPFMTYDPAKGYGFEYSQGITSYSNHVEIRDWLMQDYVTSKNPFYFSVKLPEGNYNVRALLGDHRGATVTTIKAECRRLMVEKFETGTGKEKAGGNFKWVEFTVHVKDSIIRTSAGESKVKLKPREREYLHWDDKLTLEFNNTTPKLCALEITKVDNIPTIFLAGNSTVVDQANEPWAAWGQMIPAFFQPAKVAVANYAESGETLKAFKGERRLEKVWSMAKPGDYLFIEFAHNDQKPGTSHLDAFTTYKETLKEWIAEARQRGVTPVMVTSMNRRTFDSTGLITNSLGDYPEAVRQVGKEENVAVIDLNAMSKILYEALGPDRSIKAFVHFAANTYPNQPNDVKDNTHFSTYGAYQLAKCVVNGIKANVPNLAKFLKKDLPTFDPASPDDPAKWDLPKSTFLGLVKPDGN
ncbi:MAG TPA: DUF4982 domain-containing protein [Chitinophagaceae bacterium]